MSDGKKDKFGAYLSYYGVLRAMDRHFKAHKKCKPVIFPNDFSDPSMLRFEIGWKCGSCGRSWRIAVRRLRATIHDKRIDRLERRRSSCTKSK